MNIKQAKQEVVDTVEAYLMKDEYGEYVIPSVIRGRCFSLVHRESERRRSWSRRRVNAAWHWWRTRSHTTPDRVRSDFRLFEEGIRRQGILGDRIYDERDRCKYL